VFQPRRCGGGTEEGREGGDEGERERGRKAAGMKGERAKDHAKSPHHRRVKGTGLIGLHVSRSQHVNVFVYGIPCCQHTVIVRGKACGGGRTRTK